MIYQSECFQASYEANNVMVTYAFVVSVARRTGIVTTRMQFFMKRGVRSHGRLDIRRIRAGHRVGKERLWYRSTGWAKNNDVCSKVLSLRRNKDSGKGRGEGFSFVSSRLEIHLLRPVFVLPACAVAGQGCNQNAWGLSIVCDCSREHANVHCPIVHDSKKAFMPMVYISRWPSVMPRRSQRQPEQLRSSGRRLARG